VRVGVRVGSYVFVFLFILGLRREYQYGGRSKVC
jgi:hypothetical protein